MGEYATLRATGEHVKIGTCENMLYLRADQVHEVAAKANSLDPAREGPAGTIRFRFPWPDEDGTAPGHFADPFRRLEVRGVTAPAELDHHTVVFHSTDRYGTTPRYTATLPCPEATTSELVRRVGLARPTVALVQQRYWEGRLVAVCDCMGCGARYRLPTLADAEPLLVGIRAMADAHERAAARPVADVPDDDPVRADARAAAAELHLIADRVTAGYDAEAAAAILDAGRPAVDR